jgi:NADPH2:quinone reductase
MKEAIVNSDLSVEIKDSPIPKPGPGDVLIKVAVSGSNPKDWKIPKW